MKTPILFLTWIRPDVTAEVFSQIRKAKPERLYIAQDGPRCEEERTLMMQTRDVIKVDWDCEVKYLHREENLGCKRGVSEAITWFFEQEEMGIILEDDCYPDMSFFPFCEELLEKYKDDTRVMHICGRPDIKYFNKRDISERSYYYTKILGCWGWASWRRAWQYFDINMSNFNDFVKESAIDKFLPCDPNINRYLEIFKSHSTGKEKGWAWIYAYSLLCQNALCIRSSKVLINNIGVNHEISTHKHSGAADVIYKKEVAEFPLIHPNFMVAENYINQKELNKKTLLKKEVLSNGRVKFYLFGKRIYSYKTKNTKILNQKIELINLD
ncbi:MAG: hypothetical protein R3Y43_02115 [Alphaproteobacteria bacterium]